MNRNGGEEEVKHLSDSRTHVAGLMAVSNSDSLLSCPTVTL